MVARTLKRMRPAPQGRGYRVRKRSNHVTIIVDTKKIKSINLNINKRFSDFGLNKINGSKSKSYW